MKSGHPIVGQTAPRSVIEIRGFGESISRTSPKLLNGRNAPPPSAACALENPAESSLKNLKRHR